MNLHNQPDPTSEGISPDREESEPLQNQGVHGISNPEIGQRPMTAEQQDSSEYLIKKIVESTVSESTNSTSASSKKDDSGVAAAGLDKTLAHKSDAPQDPNILQDSHRPGTHQGLQQVENLEQPWNASLYGMNSEFQELDPKSVLADRIVFLIIFAVVLIISIASSTGVSIANGVVQWPAVLTIAISGSVCLVVCLLMIFWPQVEFKNVRWRLDKLGFEIHKGVFWKHRIAVPLARIQHVDVTQGPIERFFSLGSIIVYTAGSQSSAVKLNGLNHQVAKDLKDHILKSREAQHVL